MNNMNIIIIKWVINYDEPGIAEPWCPCLNKEGEIYAMGGTDYHAILCDGIVEQKALDELGEVGFVAVIIIACCNRYQLEKTENEVIMDKYAEEFKKEFKKKPHEFDKKEVEDFNKFMHAMPEEVHENPYFRRQLSEEWQTLLYDEYDDNDGCILTYNADGRLNTVTRYYLIEGKIYVERVRDVETMNQTEYKYDNDFQVIEEIINEYL